MTDDFMPAAMWKNRGIPVPEGERGWNEAMLKLGHFISDTLNDTEYIPGTAQVEIEYEALPGEGLDRRYIGRISVTVKRQVAWFPEDDYDD